MMRYHSIVTHTTVAGRGNPKRDGAQRPRCILKRLFRALRLRTFMVVPGGASFGWAGLPLRPVFHPRPCAAAPYSTNAAVPARGLA